MKRSVTVFALLAIVVTSAANSYFGTGNAHTFSGDESAFFLTTVELMKIEAKEAQSNLASNLTLAKDHADELTEHLTANDTKEISERNERVANDLNKTLASFQGTFEGKSAPTQTDVDSQMSQLNDILGEVVSVRIDKDQMNNNTVKALVVNDLVGEALEHYGEALGVSEEQHNDESHNETSTPQAENSTASESTHDNQTAAAETSTLVNQAAYQSAKAIAERAAALFGEIKSVIPANSTNLAANISSGFDELKSGIDKLEHFDAIDKIVDDKISAGLNEAFNLKLPSDEEH
jgi:hypothetical protein